MAVKGLNEMNKLLDPDTDSCKIRLMLHCPISTASYENQSENS